MTTRGSHVNRLERHWQKSPPVETAAEPEHGSWGEMAKSWEEICEDLMGSHPKLTIVAAMALGLFLGWIVKRK